SRLPMLEIQNPTPKPPPAPLLIPKTPTIPPPPSSQLDASSADSRLDGAARVPSCVLQGTRLVNFALNDLNGDRWEFKNRKCKLALIDFWGTWCMPCRESIPALINLQNLFGMQGLEVIGIAIEQRGGTEREQAVRVNRVARDSHINYRQLLSFGDNCPVRYDLKIENLPTM